MSIATPLHNHAHGIEHHANDAFGNMTYSQGSDFSVLPDIYQDNHNLVIWQRTLSDELIAHVTQCIAENPRLNLEKGIAANAIADDVNAALTPLGFNEELIENIASLVDMFWCLFDLKRAGLRLKVLERAMCPRFHVDWVPCRLVTTFSGTGTQWIPTTRWIVLNWVRGTMVCQMINQACTVMPVPFKNCHQETSPYSKVKVGKTTKVRDLCIARPLTMPTKSVCY
tara:strand:- start:29 stop:706 length:678 start_codon:yes stop_codon:yes gene_type:complete